jgi:hypothetical protein
VRVVVDSSSELDRLMEALAAAHCLVRRLDDTSCRVRLLDRCTAEEALAELRFFLAAWVATGRSRSAGVVAPRRAA